jgi:hypothetical protein
MKRLFPPLPIFDGETMMSWVGRLAAYHADADIVQFLQDMEIAVEDAIGGRDSAIARLSEITGYDAAAIASHALRRCDEQHILSIGRMQFSRIIIAPGIRFCPLCLAEDDSRKTARVPYRHGRIDWLFSTTRVCPEHHIPLVNQRVESWGERIRDFRRYVKMSTEELQFLGKGSAKYTPSPLQEYVIARHKGEHGPLWLDNQRADFAIRAIQLLGCALIFGVTKSPTSMSLEEYIEAEKEGWKWAARGEAGICAALEILQERSRSRGETGSIMKAAFGVMYSNYGHKPRKEKEPMAEVIRNHINRTVDVRIGQKVLGVPIEKEFVISARRLATDNDLDPRTVRSVIVSKGLLPPEATNWPCSHVVVPVEDGEKIVEQMTSATPLFEAKNALNVSRPVMKLLVDLGIIMPLYERGNKTGKVSLSIGRNEIERFVHKIECVSQPVSGEVNGWVSPSKAAEILKVPLFRILPIIFSGGLLQTIRISTEKGFGSIRISLEETKYALNREAVGLPVEKAFKKLGIGSVTGNILIQRNYLYAYTDPNTGDAFVSESEIKRFNGKWITAPDLDRSLHHTTGNFTCNLSKFQIEPVLMSSEFKADFYDRAELKRLNLIR